MKLETWAGTDVGLVRKSNQDATGAFPDLSLFVVADGMGGRAEGEIASGLAVQTIRELIAHDPAVSAGKTAALHERPRLWDVLRGVKPNSRPRSDGPDLAGAVAVANQRVYETGQSHPESPRGSMGTTVVALFCALAERRAYWAHVGDSRLYRARTGDFALLTADHTILGEAYWKQATVPLDLPHTNRLVRAIGIEPSVEVTLGADELRPGDLYLLCTDGISGMVAPSELRDLLLNSAALSQTGESLIRLALAAGGRDNATAMLVRVSEE